MAFYHRSGDKKKIAHDFRRQEEEVIGSLCRLGNRPISPKTQLEQEKRIRREIANSNERRRMQSINAGFQSLRTLLPHHEGEKLSKAAILQNTADYIYQLEQEKTRLLSQNCQLKRVVSSTINHDSDGSCSDSPLPKRKKTEADIAADNIDEGIGNMSPSRSEPGVDEVRREMIDLRLQLDRERRLRMMLEEQMRNLETQMYPERIREIAQQVQLQYQSGSEDSGKRLPSLSMVLESSLKSPQSQISSEEIESSHEMALTESSPEHIVEAPEDLSGKSCLLLPIECVSEVITQLPVLEIPSTIDTTKSLSLDIPASPTPSPLSPAAMEEIPQQVVYNASTSRQNLETIVEAIRHLEGDHLFRDDPEPSESELVQWTVNKRADDEQSEEQTQNAALVCMKGDYAFRHQIIRNAPLIQSRPGVIVSNHS